LFQGYLMSHESPLPIAVQHVHEEIAFRVSTSLRFEHEALLLILRGDGGFTCGGASCEVRGPQACFLRGGESFENALVGEIEYWVLQMHWNASDIGEAGAQHLQFTFCEQMQKMPRLLALDALTACQFVEHSRALDAALHASGITSLLKSRGTLLQLLSLYFSHAGQEGSKTLHRGMARLRELLVKHACEDTALSELAASAGVAPTHAGELFRKEFGVRPVEFRTQIRLEKARDMLASSTFNIKEVARKCGYPDPLYFSKLFRRHFGLSPAEIIHRYRSAPQPGAEKDR
jgi:AraC-like DNA-binding protein